MRLVARLMLGMLALIWAGAASQAGSLTTVGFYRLDDQRLTGETTVIGKRSGYSDLAVLVTIDAAGRVIEAKPIENFLKLDPAPALALVRRWTFRPQTFDGKSVNAVGTVRVAYRERPIPADTSVGFPEGAPADTTITLKRGACFGSCPDYRVTVRGDGQIIFDTEGEHFKGAPAQVHLENNGHHVLLPGRHTARVDPALVARLLERFRAAHFFGLKNEYVYGATDNSTQALTVRIGKASKTVIDYIGTLAGMPQEVRDLEEAVDLLAGTARWVSGDARTLEELDATGFDYKSHAGELLAIAAAWKLGDYRSAQGGEAFITGLIDRGLPLETKDGGVSASAALIQIAASQGLEALFDKLVDRKVLAAMPRSALSAAFVDVGCSPKIARALVRSGADPQITSDKGTALTALRGGAATCDERPDQMLEMARTLIALGVPLEARDDLGWTALMGCDSPELAQLLLAHGANARTRATDGMTPVLATDDDRVALVLLRAGADPLAHNDQGTVRSSATKRHWPATIAWLDEHQIP